MEKNAISISHMIKKTSSGSTTLHLRYPGRFTNHNQYMTGTFVHIKKDYSQKNFQKWLKNEMPVALQKSGELDFRHDILST